MASKTTSVFFKDSHCPSLLTDTTPKRQWTTPIRCTPSKNCKTPSRHMKTTPGDRYVPSRSRDMEFSRFQMNTPSRRVLKPATNLRGTPSGNKEPAMPMRECLLALKGQSSENSVLGFQQATPNLNHTPGKYAYWNTYSNATPQSTTPKKQLRKVPKSADKVLDAPNLINDFYLNLLDWSKQDTVSVALGSSVYVFNAEKGDVHQLCDLDSLYVTSVQWSRSGKYLAVGTSDAQIQLWDVNLSKCIRKMCSHHSRVSSLSWRPQCSLLTSGAQDGSVQHSDPRVAQHQVHSLRAHSLDVCGLKWSSNGRFLASGGNDNVVNIWDTCSADPWTGPSHSLRAHKAAVKALAWCPWQANVLASGGGSADRTIQLWNAYNGNSQGHVETDSQVSGLVWSSEHRELLSGHGSTSNALRLWRWQVNSSNTPLSLLAEMSGHEGRVLHVASSPDGQSVVTAGADETLRFWKCFEKGKKTHQTSKGASTLDSNISKFIR